MILLKNKNGITLQQKRNNHLQKDHVEGYKKRVKGVIVEIYADKRNIQSNKMITDGWKPIYE